MIPNPNLNEKERELYRLDVQRLSRLKEMANPRDPKWAELIQRKEAEFKRKWGVTQTH